MTATTPQPTLPGLAEGGQQTITVTGYELGQTIARLEREGNRVLSWEVVRQCNAHYRVSYAHRVTRPVVRREASK
jgi:hypothetical protein